MLVSLCPHVCVCRPISYIQLHTYSVVKSKMVWPFYCKITNRADAPWAVLEAAVGAPWAALEAAPLLCGLPSPTLAAVGLGAPSGAPIAAAPSWSRPAAKDLRAVMNTQAAMHVQAVRDV